MTDLPTGGPSGDFDFFGDGEITDEDVEEFEEWLGQGGQALINQEEAVREAERQRMIKRGEISFEDLADVMMQRLRRFRSFVDMNAPPVILRAELDLLRSGMEDLETSYEHVVPEPSDANSE